MCIFGKPKSNTTVQQTVPNPNATAEPTKVGSARKQEDQSLFGGTPDLRVARSGTPSSVTSSGAGLNLM